MGKRNLAIGIGFEPIIFYSKRVSKQERSLLRRPWNFSLKGGWRLRITAGKRYPSETTADLFYPL
jgi:hypothetical protein